MEHYTHDSAIESHFIWSPLINLHDYKLAPSKSITTTIIMFSNMTMIQLKTINLYIDITHTCSQTFINSLGYRDSSNGYYVIILYKPIHIWSHVKSKYLNAEQ